jgi:FkbM family methyltransferase
MIFNTESPKLKTRGPNTLVLDSFYINTKRKDYIQQKCKNEGFWEPEVTKWMLKNIKPGWVCLDLGFHVGYHSEVMSRLVGKNGLVIGFEPNVDLIKDWEFTTVLNKDSEKSKIKIIPYAVSDKTSMALMAIQEWNLGASFILNENFDIGSWIKESDDRSARVVKIDTLNNLYTGPIDFIKIDIEGSEELAWAGFSDNAKNCKIILVELNKRHSTEFLNFIFKEYNVSTLDGVKIDIMDILNNQYSLVVLNKK